MNLDWDDPFGELKVSDPTDSLGGKAFEKAGGLFTPIKGIDAEQIRDAQKNLYAHFQLMHDEAIELLEESDLITRKLSEREVFSRVIYRMPDTPHLVNDFRVQETAHVVTLTETGEKAHPLIEDLFPVRHISELSVAEQKALHDTVCIKLMRPTMLNDDLPQHIRIVLPEVLHQIMHWIREVEAPIKAYKFFVRRPEKDYTRHAVIAMQLH